MDLLPTCLDVAGVDDAGLDYSLEGMSLIGVIRGQEDNSCRQLFWEHEGNRAVRKGDWKLVSRYEDDVRYFQNWEFPIDPRTQEWELYNVADDRWELNELSLIHPEIVEELKKDYEQYYQRVGAIPRKEVIKGSNQQF